MREKRARLRYVRIHFFYVKHWLSLFLNLWLWISGKPCSVAGEPVGDQSAACSPVRTGGGDHGGTETIHGLDTSSPGHHCAAGSAAAEHSRCAGIHSVVQQQPRSNKPKQSMLILLHQRPYTMISPWLRNSLWKKWRFLGLGMCANGKSCSRFRHWQKKNKKREIFSAHPLPH